MQAERRLCSTSLCDHHPIGRQHQPHRGLVSRQQRVDSCEFIGESAGCTGQLCVCDRQITQASQRIPGRLAQGSLGIESVEVEAQHLGQRQQAQRLGGGSAVNHDGVEAAGGSQGSHLGKGKEFLQAGQQGQLLGLKLVEAGPCERSSQPPAHLVPRILQPLTPTELLGMTPRRDLHR